MDRQLKAPRDLAPLPACSGVDRKQLDAEDDGRRVSLVGTSGRDR